jgi:hypothetical protein
MITVWVPCATSGVADGTPDVDNSTSGTRPRSGGQVDEAELGWGGHQGMLGQDTDGVAE